MEIRDHCLKIVQSESLEAKLSLPSGELTDLRPGPAIRLESPGRPEELRIVPASAARVPSIEGMPDPAQRRRIVHAFANHELQAAELFAWALLAFPDSPAEFRRGLLRILREEQVHCRLYSKRLKSWDMRLGDHPVSGYFWNKVSGFLTPAHFVCAMSLTFENANLDHTIDYAEAARKAGDEETARLLDRIHEDEIGHVRFGWHWLARLKNERKSMADAYLEHTCWPLRPALARGGVFHPEGREAAGLDADFLRMLAEADGEPSPEDGTEGAGRGR